MNPLNWIKTKASRAFSAVLYPYGSGAPVWNPSDGETLMREGYKQNAVVYACVNLIADNFADLSPTLYRRVGDDVERVAEHAALDLLRRPNAMDSEYDFKKAWAAYLLLTGDAYVDGSETPETGPNRGVPRELYVLRSDHVEIKAGTRQEPVQGYVYTEGGAEIDYEPQEIAHSKLFNPLHPFYGMSPLEAAARGVDSHNMASTWNYHLLKNGASPPWMMNIKGNVSPDEKEKFKDQVDRKLSGPSNAGKPIVMRGADGVEITQLGLSPVEMGWLDGKTLSALEIASAFKVGGQLVGIPDSQTYANYEQAYRALYTEAVLPLFGQFCDMLTRWLLERYDDEGLFFWYEKDEIDALQEDQTERIERAAKAFDAGIATQRQAAEIAGLPTDDAQDVFKLRMTDQLVPAGSQDVEAEMEKARREYERKQRAA